MAHTPNTNGPPSNFQAISFGRPGLPAVQCCAIQGNHYFITAADVANTFVRIKLDDVSEIVTAIVQIVQIGTGLVKAPAAGFLVLLSNQNEPPNEIVVKDNGTGVLVAGDVIRWIAVCEGADPSLPLP